MTRSRRWALSSPGPTTSRRRRRCSRSPRSLSSRAPRLANVALRERACAEAMGYDLHGEHNVVLVHGDDSALADAVGRAAADGRVEQFMREWLGTLLEYDRDHRADLVHTSSRYLECVGNYHDSAAMLHIHRSTLRYRLGRIRELTGFDTRAWRWPSSVCCATRTSSRSSTTPSFLPPVAQPP
ncbi:PucR family transcriptional regulator [Nocardia gipuzkoensis]|uniref:PucR family transcriptional regulator n=1 Tax=Nocardia gipuzkoensis TaxID=2749991 RepID=UPI002D806517|nr:helix-turn-helix domain-containing protein [Nocardia gipuzkoensis]